jgi:arsenate reductase
LQKGGKFPSLAKRGKGRFFNNDALPINSLVTEMRGGQMKKIMFLCTANSCRSQMAEGFAKEYGRGIVEVYSAGLMAAGVQHRAIAVMKEIGIDISNQQSKEIDPDLLRRMDIVVTLCGHAEETCPWTPPEIKRIHWPIKDPVGATGTEDQIRTEFRRARDEIKEKVEELMKAIAEGKI